MKLTVTNMEQNLVRTQVTDWGDDVANVEVMKEQTKFGTKFFVRVHYGKNVTVETEKLE